MAISSRSFSVSSERWHNMRCRFKIEGNTVTATTMYAGKLISATAKCGPFDTFDEEIGKKLAEKRLEYKVAKKRERYYTDLMDARYKQFFEFSKDLARICKKRNNAVEQLYAAQKILYDYIDEINI